jgi:radical SAM superfamily enzyme
MKIIPIFIPHAGCPYKCVYCDQHKISGSTRSPAIDEIKTDIERHLATIPKTEKIEIAFFGGTFTLLPESLQEQYLDAAGYFGKPLRMSTHPEAVSMKNMRMFRNKGGRLVELGIQSLDKDVLRKIKRPTSLGAVKNAAARVKKAGLRLGVQMMLGLPGDSIEKSISTAKELVKLKPETARIYPTLVIKGTELEKIYKRGRYKPLGLQSAIEQSAMIADIFESAGIKVIRIGLHPSKGLASKNVMVAGPYHPAFGEMARARQMRNRIIRAVKDRHAANRSRLEIYVPAEKFNLVSGHKAAERKFLEAYFKAPVHLFQTRIGIRSRCGFGIRDVRKNIAVIDPRMPPEAKEKLKRLNYCVIEVPLRKKLRKPVQGHPDMMMFNYKDNIIYEPGLEKIASLLRQNGYNCVKGKRLMSGGYPEDIIYNACAIGRHIIRYKGRVENNIANIRARHIPVSQGYAKCSIIPVDNKHIITANKGIKTAWEQAGGEALLIKPGHIELPGYKTGFIGGATGVNEKTVFFTGSLSTHPDGKAIRKFIEKTKKSIIELRKARYATPAQYACLDPAR